MSMFKPKVYLASGWFDDEQKKQMEEIHGVLASLKEEGKIELFAPFYDGMVLEGKSKPMWRQEMQEVWDLDIRELSSSELVVVSTQNHDVGTIFESGYASALKIPILCYNSNPELGLNVMLAQEARGFCKSPLRLREAIEAFIGHREKLLKSEYESKWRYNLWEGEPI